MCTRACKQLIVAGLYIKMCCDSNGTVGLLSPLEQEHFQFAQETVKAEAWLKAKEPLITSKQPEGGVAQAQTDEAEQLILRHEAFRKAAVTWKERFSSLRQLSAVSLTVDKFLIGWESHSLILLQEKFVTLGYCICLANMGICMLWSSSFSRYLAHIVYPHSLHRFYFSCYMVLMPIREIFLIMSFSSILLALSCLSFLVLIGSM